MLIGIFAGLVTGALWGLTFVAPRAVVPFTEVDLAIARYAIFGVASFILMLSPNFRPTGIRRGQKIIALLLGGAGYVSYFIAAALAVRFAGPAIPPLIIGILPVALAVIGNWRDDTVSWQTLAVPLGLIAAGVLVVNLWSLWSADPVRTRGDIALGILCATLALVIWIVYGVVNARAMRMGEAPSPLPWTGLQGIGAALGTIPLIAWGWTTSSSAIFASVSSAETLHFLGWALVMGVAGSWGATWCWSIASQRLPLALSAQLIVAETIFGLVYGFAFEGRLPVHAEWIGAALQLVGVAAAVTVFTKARTSPPAVVQGEETVDLALDISEAKFPIRSR